MTTPFTNDDRYVGRDYGTFEYHITPELIATYTEGTGDDHPWYRGDSPLGGPLAPALILHSAVYKDTHWYLPKIFGNLHARQEWENFAPVMVGETIRAHRMIVERYLKRDREYVVCEVILTNGAGMIVARSRTHQSFIPETKQTEGFAVDKSREKDPSRAFKIGASGGEPFDAPARTITEAMCYAFSGPARNYHNDRAKAVELGFPEIVVQGMLSVCLVSEMMTRRFGLGWYYGGKMDLRLVNVVWGNDVTGPRGSVIGHYAEGRFTRASAEVWCDKSDGTKTIVGSASALEL
ncbi:MAG TPA: MaoC family dehydratase [Candidatus Binataceae bacterium]|nr:MaoC family dehydratase [Candidatus Binataceae bacterium]